MTAKQATELHATTVARRHRKTAFTFGDFLIATALVIGANILIWGI